MLSIRRKMLQRFALNSFVSGDFERAERYFLQLKEADPDRMGVDHNMGLVKLGLKQYEAAESYLLRDLELFGETYLRSRTLGDLYYIWGRAEKAKKRYSAALRQAEEESDRLLLQKRIEICSDDSAFARAAESHRSFEEGVRLQKTGDSQGARAALTRAVEGDPTNFQAWNNLGSVLMEDSSTYDEALKCFTRARSYSALPSIVRNLEEAKNRSGRKGES
ncbi:tetratricopeptide repeat protein [Salinispira pacifica]